VFDDFQVFRHVTCGGYFLYMHLVVSHRQRVEIVLVASRYRVGCVGV